LHVATVRDNVPEGKIKNIKELSGATLLVEAIDKAELPVNYEARSGTIDDLTIHLLIGIKP